MKITVAQVVHLQAPLETPYQTTFGTMENRHAVVIFLTNDEGITGVGESWINFPLWAPWERVAAFSKGFFPHIIGSEIGEIPEFTAKLFRKKLRASSLQSATLGPTMQALCAVEIALWDIRAKSEDVPLGCLFEEQPAGRLKVYGSGINPPIPFDIINDCIDIGIDCFKLKVGYGAKEDQENIKKIRRHVGQDVNIAVDVNRNWKFEEVIEWMPFLNDMNIRWLEEPLVPDDEGRYGELKEQSTIPISAGENFLIPPGSELVSFAEKPLDIVQPSVVKNCRFSDALILMRLVEERNAKLYPHYLGSAPGLAATAHLASLTSERHLELDLNPNPLRTSLFTNPFLIEDGFLHLSDRPGIGWDIDPEKLEKWTVKHD